MKKFLTILAVVVTIFVLIVVGTQIVSCVRQKQQAATANTALDCTVKFETVEYNETSTTVYATVFIKNIGTTTVTTFDIQVFFVNSDMWQTDNQTDYLADKYPKTGGFVLTDDDGNATGEKTYELKTNQQAKLGKTGV